MSPTTHAQAPLLVLTATLGVSEWLEACVNSVTNCTGGEAIHVLIAPQARVAELTEKFTNCVVVEDAGREGGLYGALNKGLEAALTWSWQWMTFLADDDLLLPGFFELYKTARKETTVGAAAVWHGEVLMTNEQGKRLCRVPYTRNADDITPLVVAGYSPFNQQSMLFSREAATRAGYFPTHLKICGDASHWLSALEGGAEFKIARVPSAIFRVREGQLSGVISAHSSEFRSLAERAQRLHGNKPVWPAIARFRISNIPIYIERVFRVGFVNGFGLLEKT